MELQLRREGGREVGGRERNEGKDVASSYTCMHVHTTAAVEGGRERGTSGQRKTTEEVTKKCTHTHAHTHTHTHLSCPVYQLSYNNHVTLIDEEAKSKHLSLGVLIMFSSCTTSVHCYPSLAQEPTTTVSTLH